jgi:amino acid transporter
MAEGALPSAGAVAETSVKRSGLLPEMGWRAVFLFAVCGIGLTYSGLVPFASIAGLWPGSDLVGVLSVALVLALVHAYTYSVIGSVARRNGADYIIASRVLSAPLAFASSWTLVIFMAIAAGSIVASILQESLPMFARMQQILFSDSTLVNTLPQYTGPAGVVLFGTVGVVLLFIVLILSPRVTRQFLLVGLLLSLVVWGIFYIQLAPATAAGFQAAWDRAMGEGAYLHHLLEARRLGMQVSFGPAPMLSAGLVLGFTIFFGYFNGTFIAHEVKSPEKNLLRGSWFGLIFAWAVLAVGALLVQRIIPLEWLSAESYLSRVGEYRTAAMPWLPFYAAVLNPNRFFFWTAAISWVVSLLALACTFLYAGSRIITAWAQDGLLPKDVRYVHPVLRSPLIAVLLVCIVAEVGLTVSAFGGGIEAQINPVLFMAAVQLLPVLSITLFPFLKRDWFESSPDQVRSRLGRLPVITIVGALSFIYLVWTITAALIFPTYASVNNVTLVLFAGIFVAGLVWFFALRIYHRRSQEKTVDPFLSLPVD